MKKIFTLFFLSAMMVLSVQIKAQCPGCVVDTSCVITPAKPVLCPDTLPPGTALQYYDQDITFYMPVQFVDEGTGFNVTLNRIEVTGVVGIPYGLNFQSSSATNNFYPSSNPPQTEHGCAKFCGTPLLPGNYVITVFIKAYVTVLGLNQTQDDSFEIPVTILPSAGSAMSFDIGTPDGCAPLTTSFTANYQSLGNPHYSYNWDFGNGQTFSGEFPPSQTYPLDGTYIVSLATTIDTLDYSLSSVSVSGSASQCDDIFDGPDYFMKIYQGSTLLYQSSNVTNQSSASFSFPTIVLSNSIYSIEVWDNDDFMGGGATGDDWCTTVSFNGQTAGSHYLTSNGLNVGFIIDHPVLNFNESDTVTVYPSPIFEGNVISPNDTACLGDSVLLSTTGSYVMQWFYNGVAIAGATDSLFVAYETGLYHVNIMNQFGCITEGDPVALMFMAYPPTPTFWQTGNTLQTMMTGYDLQWYFNGNPISGANGQTYEITESGLYNLEASNTYGCSTLGNSLYATYTDIEDGQHPALRHLSVFPNPVSESIHVSFDTQFAGTLRITINDLLNKNVFSKEYEMEGAEFYEIIDMTFLPQGVYMLQLQHDMDIYTRKIMKQ